MAKISGKLSKWRDYFGSSKSNIFDIIEHAIIVSAIDHPKEFKLRRDRIAELLFSCKITRGNGCDKVEFVVPNADNNVVTNADKVVPNADKVVPNVVDVDVDTRKRKNEVVKERKSDVNVNKTINVSNEEEAKKLSDEIEVESRFIKEVLRNKKIIDNNQNESDLSVYASLRKLQQMTLSVEILKATGVGKSVNALRRHKSMNIQNLVKKMVESWREMVNEYCAERTPESPKASVVGEEGEGLPTPPWEDLPFIANQATSITLSRVFDGLDDDGNALSCGQSDQNHEDVRKANNPVRRQQNVTAAPKANNPVRRQQNVAAAPKVNNPVRRQQNITAAPKDKKGGQQKKQTSLVKPNKPPGDNSRPGRPIKPTFQRKLNNDDMKLQQKSDRSKIQTRHVPTQRNKLKRPDEDAEHVKLETTKRKFQERYQEVERAKRQRMVQVMDLRDIHREDIRKQGLRARNPHLRPANHNRPLVNRRQ